MFTIPRIYILTLKLRGEPLSTSEIDIYTLTYTSNEIWTLVQTGIFYELEKKVFTAISIQVRL